MLGFHRLGLKAIVFALFTFTVERKEFALVTKDFILKSTCFQLQNNAFHKHLSLMRTPNFLVQAFLSFTAAISSCIFLFFRQPCYVPWVCCFTAFNQLLGNNKIFNFHVCAFVMIVNEPLAFQWAFLEIHNQHIFIWTKPMFNMVLPMRWSEHEDQPLSVKTRLTNQISTKKLVESFWS